MMMVAPVRSPGSRWLAATQLQAHPALAFNVRVDVAVIGGGLTGATAAYLLKRSGHTVALVEKGQCGHGETGRSAADVTVVPRGGLADLVSRIGADRARLLWEARLAAVTRLRALVRDERINCDFAWVPGVVYAPSDMTASDARAWLARERTAAGSLGIEASEQRAVSGLGGPGLLFEGQARIHPLNYVTVLAGRLPGDGSHVFEGTAIDQVEGTGPFVLCAGQYRVAADRIVQATHLPWTGGLDDESRYRTLGLRVGRAELVSGTSESPALAEGLYWTAAPGAREYLRVDRSTEHVDVCLGRYIDSREGGAAAAGSHGESAARLSDLVPDACVTHEWSAAVVETADGLPVMGETSPGRFVATGYGLEPTTYGTLAGMMAADALGGRTNPWRDLFAVGRHPAHRAASSGPPDPPSRPETRRAACGSDPGGIFV